MTYNYYIFLIGLTIHWYTRWKSKCGWYIYVCVCMQMNMKYQMAAKNHQDFWTKVFFQVLLNFSKKALFKLFLNKSQSHPGSSVCMPVQETFGSDCFPLRRFGHTFLENSSGFTVRSFELLAWNRNVNLYNFAELIFFKGQVGLFKDIKNMHI